MMRIVPASTWLTLRGSIRYASNDWISGTSAVNGGRKKASPQAGLLLLRETRLELAAERIKTGARFRVRSGRHSSGKNVGLTSGKCPANRP